MPTFSYPSTTTPIPTPAPTPTPTPATKKPRDRKKASAPAPPPVPVPEPAPEPEEPVFEHCDVEEEDNNNEVSEPTFPDIVILKQTEHNYIVKHNIDIVNENAVDLVSPNQIHKNQINKKRGRKPKAGLLMNANTGMYDVSEVPNIILHLKCHLSDLKNNESISNYEYTPLIREVESYNVSTMTNTLQSSNLCNGTTGSEIVSTENDSSPDENDDTPSQMYYSGMYTDKVVSQVPSGVSTSTCEPGCATIPPGVAIDTMTSTTTTTTTTTTGHCVCGRTSDGANGGGVNHRVNVLYDKNNKEIMKKINRLKYSFHSGEPIQTKINHKSACFWDTCEFDGPVYYIPIMLVNGVFHVSGCFCSPECAVASLLKEPIDTSTKFERLHLLNLLYGNPNGKGFKPAPNPNYLLDKYYGNLTIQEYRTLLKGTQIIHVVNKPLTHILPELYEDNNDFLVNSKVIPTNNMKLKKRYKTMVVQSGGLE